MTKSYKPGRKCRSLHNSSCLSPTRRWFLDMIVEIGDARILKFLSARFEGRDVQPYEALQTFMVALNHLRASPELIEESKVHHW